MSTSFSRRAFIAGALGLGIAGAANAQTAPYAHTQSDTTPYAPQGDCTGPAYAENGTLRCQFVSTAPQPVRPAQRIGDAPVPATEQPIDVWGRYGTPLPRQVAYAGNESAGTILIDHKNLRLYLVEGGNRAREYVIAVGAPGFAIDGDRYIISRKALNPDWRPTQRMLRENPTWLPFYAGGPQNPMGSMALYLNNSSGATLYRIHGTNDPEMIGHEVSDGCIRLQNADALDLFERARVGAVVKISRDGVALRSQIRDLPNNNGAPAVTLR